MNAIILQDGDTLVLRDGNSLLACGLSTGRISRIPGYSISPADRDRLRKDGLFRSITHRPVTGTGSTDRAFRSLMLLVSRRCSLSCIYCYASATTDGPMMSVDTAIRAVDSYLSQPPRSVQISFHGGGEPTLNMKVLKAVVRHVRSKTADRPARFSIVTNGVMPTSALTWLMSEKFDITISWDGPNDIQDRNRPLASGCPSSPLVSKTINRLVSGLYPFVVRSTMSPTDDIERIIAHFAQAGVPSLHLEPLFPHGRQYDEISFGEGTGHRVCAPTAQDLAETTMHALELCEQHNMRLINSAIKDGLPRFRFATFCGTACARSMVVTHDGHLTACSEVVDREDEAASAYWYGTLEQRNINIQRPALIQLLRRHTANMDPCATCAVRYACGAGCAVKAFRQTNSHTGVDPIHCEYVRTITPLLIHRMATRRGI